MMEDELVRINERVRELESQVDNVTGVEKQDLEQELADLKDRQEQIERKLDAVLASEEEKEMRLETEQAAAEMHWDLP